MVIVAVVVENGNDDYEGRRSDSIMTVIVF